MKESGSNPCDSSVELLALAASADAVVGTVITMQCILATYLIIPMLHPLYMYDHVCLCMFTPYIYIYIYLFIYIYIYIYIIYSVCIYIHHRLYYI